MSIRIATAITPALLSITDESILRLPGADRKTMGGVVIAVLAAMALGSNLAAAQPRKAKADPRAMHAHSEWTFAGDRDCVPANGAQIRGGFAASDDLIDVRTGEICGKQ